MDSLEDFVGSALGIQDFAPASIVLGQLSLLACRALHLVAAAFSLELLVIDLMHLDLDPYFVHIVEPKLGIEENLSPYQNFVEDHALRAAQIVVVQQASALVLAGVLALLKGPSGAA